jgi:hypothetical protein
MSRKKQIHENQTDLIPAEKKEIPADDVRLFLKNLTLHNMQSLKAKIATATINEHKIIQEAVNLAFKGAGLEDGDGLSAEAAQTVKVEIVGVKSPNTDT